MVVFVDFCACRGYSFLMSMAVTAFEPCPVSPIHLGANKINFIHRYLATWTREL